MEPSMSAQIEKEPKERKKIQFGIQEEPKERKKIQFGMEDEEKPKERKKIQFEMEDEKPKERKKIQFGMEDEEKPKERKKIQFETEDEKPKERKKIQFETEEEKPKERKKIQFEIEDEEDEDEEPKERKIHFAVTTSVPTNLDPRQVEMIRRRRPTPATLFRVADQGSPEDDQSTHQWVVGENGVLKPKRVNPNVYQPPSLRAVQKMAEAHMLKLGVYPYFEDPEGEEDDDDWKPRERKDCSPTTAADNQETAASERSVKFSSETETTNQSQAPQEEEEEEKEGKMERTTESSRGSN